MSCMICATFPSCDVGCNEDSIASMRSIRCFLSTPTFCRIRTTIWLLCIVSLNGEWSPHINDSRISCSNGNAFDIPDASPSFSFNCNEQICRIRRKKREKEKEAREVISVYNEQEGKWRIHFFPLPHSINWRKQWPLTISKRINSPHGQATLCLWREAFFFKFLCALRIGRMTLYWNTQICFFHLSRV